MFKINVISVGPGRRSDVLASGKVELTSEDGTEAVTVLDVRLLRDREGDFSLDFPKQPIFRSDGAHQYAPTIKLSKNLLQRIIDEVCVDYRDHHER